jgi:ribonuclease Z
VHITFLGTSSGVPTRSRNVSSVALNLPQRAEVWLFDCGEATQHQLLHCDVKISQIRRIFVTHLHGDHIFGLMGLLATYGMAGSPNQIDIYGPAGLQEYLKASQKYSYTHFNYPIKVHTIEPGVVYREAEFTVTCLPLKHKVPAFGYRVTEADRPGRFDIAQAKALGIPSGPVYGQLKNGQTVTLEDGRIINGRDLCGVTEIGRSLVYCTDTVFCENSIQLALSAQVQQLILTHFSPRYAPGNSIGLSDLLQTAQAIFPQTQLAHDFLTYSIPRRVSDC